MLREFGGGSRDSWRRNSVVGLLWYLGVHVLVMGSRLQGKRSLLKRILTTTITTFHVFPLDSRA